MSSSTLQGIATQASHILGTDLLYAVTDPGGTPTPKKVLGSAFVLKDTSDDVHLDAGVYSAGTLHGGVLYPSSLQVTPGSYTQLADPADEEFGSWVNVKWNAIIDYDNAGTDKQKIQSGYFGPRGIFNAEGVIQHDAPGTGWNGLSPLSFLSVMQQKNKSGSGNIGLTPAWTYVASNWHIADGATVTAAHNDTLNGPSAFIDTTLFVSANTGHWDALNGVGNEIYSFTSFPQMQGHVSVGTRVGFYAANMPIATSGGGSTNYPLADGSTVNLDTHNQSVALQTGFRTDLLYGATENHALEIAPGSHTLTAALGSSSYFINFLSGTTTLNFASAYLPALVNFSGTIAFQQSGNAFGALQCFSFAPTIQNVSGSTVDFKTIIGFVSSPTYKVDTTTGITGGTFHGFYSVPVTSARVGSGTITSMTWNNFTAGIGSGGIKTGYTLDTRRGFYVAGDSGITMTGTFTTQVGLDIEALTKATTNIAVRLTTTGGTWSLQQFGAVKSLHEGDLRVGYTALNDTTAPNAKLEVVQPTGGDTYSDTSETLRLSTVATNDDVVEQVFQKRVATTDATVTNLFSFTIPSSTTVLVEAAVVARRTGGSSGSAEDGAAYVIRGCFKNVGGTCTQIGSTTVGFSAESQAGWDCTFLAFGSAAIVRVTGAANNNVTWHATVRIRKVGS